MENSIRIFRCPDAFDRTAGRPTKDAYFQISYSINPDVGGKKLTDVGGHLVVIEHDDMPSCRGASDHFTPWAASAPVRADRHNANRHDGRPNSLSYDGSVP